MRSHRIVLFSVAAIILLAIIMSFIWQMHYKNPTIANVDYDNRSLESIVVELSKGCNNTFILVGDNIGNIKITYTYKGDINLKRLIEEIGTQAELLVSIKPKTIKSYEIVLQSKTNIIGKKNYHFIRHGKVNILNM